MLIAGRQWFDSKECSFPLLQEQYLLCLCDDRYMAHHDSGRCMNKWFMPSWVLWDRYNINPETILYWDSVVLWFLPHSHWVGLIRASVTLWSWKRGLHQGLHIPYRMVYGVRVAAHCCSIYSYVGMGYLHLDAYLQAACIWHKSVVCWLQCTVIVW